MLSFHEHLHDTSTALACIAHPGPTASPRVNWPLTDVSFLPLSTLLLPLSCGEDGP
jgi:hypothetical protein